MTITTFRRLEVTNWLSYEEDRLDGFIYLTEGSEVPTKPDYIQNYLHILKNKGGDKKYYMLVDRGEYESDQIVDLENILFDWAKGEYHQGTYKIEEIDPIKELFHFEKAEHPDVEDSQYVLKADDCLYIQVCDAYEYMGKTTYEVHKLAWIDDGSNCVTEHFGSFEKLDDAMKKVLELNRERNIHNQFPDFDDEEGFNKLLNELDKYGFEDECWHNEAMPHVCKMIPTEKYPDRAMRVWIDWKDHQWSQLHYNLKEGQIYYRFNVHLQGEYGDQDTTEFSKDFETMEEVLEFVKDYFESNVAKWTPLYDEWNNWLGKQDNIDDKQADAQAVITCYTLTEDQKEYVTDFIERWEQ